MSPTTDQYDKRDEQEAGEKLDRAKIIRIMWIILFSILGCATFLYFFIRTMGL